MKNTTHFKYIEWRDPSGLHEDTLGATSDLEFIKDELLFLEDLAAAHTLELIYGVSNGESQVISQDLDQLKKRLDHLLKQMLLHRNKLQILLDDIEIPNELKDYKKEHYSLLIKVMDFHTDFKKTKRTVFKMLSDIMKRAKSKNAD